MSNLLEDIELLIADLEPTIYIGQFPDDSPNNICTLSLLTGRPPEHVFGQTKAAFRRPSFQVRIRDTSYANAITRMEAIIIRMDGVSSSTAALMQVLMESDIVPLGQDSKDRSEFICNFRTLTNY